MEERARMKEQTLSKIEEGMVTEGIIKNLTEYGAFIDLGGLDGLLHISEISDRRVRDVRDELKEGEQVMVKVINIDPSGKIRLSRKALITPEEGQGQPQGQGGRPEGRREPARKE